MYTSNQTLKREASHATPLVEAFGALPSVSWFTALGHGKFSCVEWERQWATVAVQGVTLRGGASEVSPAQMRTRAGLSAQGSWPEAGHHKEGHPEGRIVKFPVIDRERVTSMDDVDKDSNGVQSLTLDRGNTVTGKSAFGRVLSLKERIVDVSPSLERLPGDNEEPNTLETESPTRGKASRSGCTEVASCQRVDESGRPFAMDIAGREGPATGDFNVGVFGLKMAGFPVGFCRQRPRRNRRRMHGPVKLEQQRNYDALGVTIWALRRCRQRFWTQAGIHMNGI